MAKRRGGANPVIEDGGLVGPFVAFGVDPSLVFGAVSQGADGALEAAAPASRGVPCGVLGVLAALLLLQFRDEGGERGEVDAVCEEYAPGVGVSLSGAAMVGGIVPAEGAEFVEAAFEASDLAFSDFEASRGGGYGCVGDGSCAGSPVAISGVCDLECEIVDLAPVHADMPPALLTRRISSSLSMPSGRPSKASAAHRAAIQASVAWRDPRGCAFGMASLEGTAGRPERGRGAAFGKMRFCR